MRLEVAPRTLQKDILTCEVNWGPQSDTMSRVIPCNLKAWVSNRLGVSKVEVLKGDKINHFGESVHCGQDCEDRLQSSP